MFQCCVQVQWESLSSVTVVKILFHGWGLQSSSSSHDTTKSSALVEIYNLKSCFHVIVLNSSWINEEVLKLRNFVFKAATLAVIWVPVLFLCLTFIQHAAIKTANRKPEVIWYKKSKNSLFYLFLLSELLVSRLLQGRITFKKHSVVFCLVFLRTENEAAFCFLPR